MGVKIPDFSVLQLKEAFAYICAKLNKVGRKNRFPLLRDVKIENFAAEGKALARVNNMVVFVPGLVPGDVADIQVTRKRKNFMEGVVTDLKQESAIRITPVCSHFGICGGCKWQQLPYEQQLKYKQQQVLDNLQRIGKVELPDIKPIIASDDQLYYRNKLEYTFSQTRWLSSDEVVSGDEIIDRRALGFHIPGKFDRILDIDTCYLQDDFSNTIRNAIREFTLQNEYSYYHQRNKVGLLRNLIIRNSNLGEWMLILVFGSNDRAKIMELMEFVKESFPAITSLMYIVNTKLNDTHHDQDVHLYSGRDHIFEELNGLKFKIGPKSFFQTNTKQAEKLYQVVSEMAALKGDEVVYDLYTGAGTIACEVARNCRKVVGIEYVEDAIRDAHINSEINGIKNSYFIAGDMQEVLTNDFINEYTPPDVIITDPPRAGMHVDVVTKLLEIGANRIVYVSCNPATQARDIQLLDQKYTVESIQAVDMFPHTHHVENVLCLVKRSSK